jgi:hypothetical protein
MLAGALAGALAAGVTTPLDVAKTRCGRALSLPHVRPTFLGSHIVSLGRRLQTQGLQGLTRMPTATPAAAVAAPAPAPAPPSPATAAAAAAAAGGALGGGSSGSGSVGIGAHASRMQITSAPPASLSAATLVTVRATGAPPRQWLSTGTRAYARLQQRLRADGTHTLCVCIGSVTVRAAVPAYHGIVSALRAIWADEGAAGLMRGFGARMLLNAPSAAISWTTYEFVKSLFLQSGGGNSSS